MSVKALVEGIEMARTNNTNLKTALIQQTTLRMRQIEEARAQYNLAADQQIEHMNNFRALLESEFTNRDDDLVRLMEGAA